MNTDDKLRRAASEMNQVTGSLTTPEIAEVRRSARMRTAGVAVAAAVGVLVIVGGSVLALRPAGDPLPGPASPGETTTTTTSSSPAQVPDEIYGHPVRVPDLDAEPGWRPYEDAVEVAAAPSEDVSSELFRAAAALQSNYEDRFREVLLLGELHGIESFVFTGELIPLNPSEGEAASYAQCLVVLAPAGGRQTTCTAEPTRGSGMLTPIRTETGVFGIVGLTPRDATTVVLEIDNARLWSRTREGFVNLIGQGAVDAVVTYRSFDHLGVELSSATIPPVVPEGGPTTTAIATPLGDCSAIDITPTALTISSFPQPVAQKLAEIVAAARACDYERLEDLAGDQFNASFGGEDPSDLWTFEEENGYAPMYWLLSILDLPHGVFETENGNLYIWPSAHAHQGDWDTLSAADIDALRTLYTEEDLQNFADFGAYIGYRVGIWEDGTWSFFVAGD